VQKWWEKEAKSEKAISLLRLNLIASGGGSSSKWWWRQQLATALLTRNIFLAFKHNANRFETGASFSYG